MAKLLSGLVAQFAKAITHEGAAAFDFSTPDPLNWLVFTKGATLFTDSFYHSQAKELFSYSQALLAAERHERGFGWKFAAYMRDPKLGKGNRIQGTVAPAVLAAADPDGPFTATYVAKCLKHRADDVAVFATHFTNLGLGEIPAAARKGMADALAQMDEYQILKYAGRQVPLVTERVDGKKKSLRLVDAMGIAKEHLALETRKLYDYLRAPTRGRTVAAEAVPMVAARRRFFAGKGTDEDFAAGRLSAEQALSFLGSSSDTWTRVLRVPGLLPDMAFKQYVRAMHQAALSVEFLCEEANRRRFAGLWPHQVYAGYQAAMNGVARTSPHGKWRSGAVFARAAAPEIAPVFEVILGRVADTLLPASPSLGIADISGSMFGAKLGGEKSSCNVGDAACVLAGLMAKRLGYAATFSDEIYIEDLKARTPVMEFATNLRNSQGWGSTQVAGSVVDLIVQLLAAPARRRPRTLYFFSDMQFHPPAEHLLHNAAKVPAEARGFFTPHTPPLLGAIHAYRALLGPVDVVLWNLAAYDNAPLPSNMEGVMMLAGFDANSFRHVTAWQEAGSPATPEKTTGAVATVARDPEAELAYIRGF